MKATQALHNLGQSIWLDNITRDLLDSGTLARYIDEFSVTGLTSNPTIFDHAIKNSTAYDAAIRDKMGKGKSGESLFFELALEDLIRAAGLFRPVHEQTDGVDGWVSLEVSPLLAHDTASTLAAAKRISSHTRRPIKICSSKSQAPRGRPAAAIEEAIFARHSDQRYPVVLPGEQYLQAAADAIPARHRAAHRCRKLKLLPASRLSPRCSSADGTLRCKGKVPESLSNQARHRDREADIQSVPGELLDSPRWQRVSNAGARPQRSCIEGPVREPKIPKHPMSSISKRWRRRSPSTPCRTVL